MHLKGRQILATGSANSLSKSQRLFQDSGAELIYLPTLELHPLLQQKTLRETLAQNHYDALALHSASGVRFFLKLMPLKKLPPLAVVGPQGKALLQAAGFKVQFMPQSYTGAALAQTLVGCQKVLSLSNAAPHPDFARVLKQNGVALTQLDLYHSLAPQPSQKVLQQLESSRQLDHTLFTSPQSARNLFEILPQHLVKKVQNSQCLAIGPSTAKALESLGLRATMATPHTLEALYQTVFAQGRPAHV